MSSATQVTGHGSDPDLHLRTELEKEVAGHFQAIARLRRHLNSLVRINRLPLELLTEIFYLCQSQTLRVVNDQRQSPYPYKWLTMAGVCHYWREAIMATPKLWAKVDLDCVALSRLHALPLAGRHPLHLMATQWGDPQRELFYEIITSRMEQVCSIYVQIADLDWVSAWDPDTDSDDPDVISHAISPLRSFTVVGGLLDKQDIPGIFVNCDFPEIRELSLRCHFGSLPTHLMGSTLTHLKLCMLGEHLKPVDPLDFTRCVSRMLRLELLHVENLSFRVDRHGGPCLNWFCDNIPSPKPHRVILASPLDEQEDYTSLFLSLDFSLISAARFKRMPDMSHYEDSCTLLRGLEKPFSPFIFRSLALHDRTPISLLINLSQTADEPDITDVSIDPPFSLWVAISSLVVQVAFETFFRRIDLRHIETLHLGNSWVSSMPSDDWLHFLSTCHCLTTLSIDGVQDQSLLRATKLLREDGRIPEASRSILVPKLRVILFRKVSWQDPDETISDHPGGLAEDLLAFIENRIHAQLPLERVGVRECTNIHPFTEALLLGTGVVLEWNNNAIWSDRRSYENYWSDTTSTSTDD